VRVVWDVRTRVRAFALAAVIAVPGFVTNFGELPLVVRLGAAAVACVSAGVIASVREAPLKKIFNWPQSATGAVA
jgi:hypothetical protein